VSAQELESKGLLGRLLTREHQELHHVKLYQGLRKEFDEYKETQAQTAAQTPMAQPEPGPEMSPEEYSKELQNRYVPHLDQLANNGAFEPEFVRAFPGVSAQLEHRMQSGGLAIFGTIKHVTELTETVEKLAEYVGLKQTEEGVDTAKMNVLERMTNVSKDLPALADEGVQSRFISWAIDENNQLTERFATKDISDISDAEVKGAFAAYVAMTGDGITQRRTQPKKESRMAGGGGGSRGSSQPVSVPQDEITAFEQEFKESQFG